MKATVFAAAAVLGLTVGGAAMAEPAQFNQLLLAVVGGDPPPDGLRLRCPGGLCGCGQTSVEYYRPLFRRFRPALLASDLLARIGQRGFGRIGPGALLLKLTLERCQGRLEGGSN